MPYSLDGRLVIAISSRALFDLDKENTLFDKDRDERAYMQYQQDNEEAPLSPGVSLPFIKRLLALNDLRKGNALVEVVLLSRNDASSGIRIQNSIKHHGLDISRMVFTRGAPPFPYLAPLNAVLFLSRHNEDVVMAMQQDLPAGLIVGGPDQAQEEADGEIRIAFDFDGVVASDDAERVYSESKSLSEYFASEEHKRFEPLPPGPLKPFLDAIGVIQELEMERRKNDPSYVPRLRIAIVTARNAPAHERAIRTLRSWNVQAHEALFLGRLEKAPFLNVLKPHMFFDDQQIHLDSATRHVACVHIPYGIRNKSHVSPKT